MLIADLHIHSKYSRATSRDCVPEYLDLWARRKGIGLVGTGDFTHPAWREELRDKLVPAGEGLYALREDACLRDPCAGAGERPRFVITGEISSIYKKGDRVRKVHNLILLPSLEAADDLARRLEVIGNIHSDGRPILGLDSRDLLEIGLEACPQAVFIPAHIWTPHFSVFGAFSGFDTLEECFGDLTPHIHALETGLSSDPPMNWRLSALDRCQLISNSDAHSPSKLGREANLLDIQPSYPALAAALQTGEGLKGTIEFFPEEGKYHFDGHRGCRQCLTPAETAEAGGRCPVCGRKITIGVLHRVEELADRPEGYVKPGAAPFESLVPLPEVIAASAGGSAAGKKVNERYEALLRELGPEFHILREAPEEDIRRVAGPLVAEGIRRLRAGQVERSPGYDGEYGVIRLLTEPEREAITGQVSLFGGEAPKPAPGKKTAPSARPGDKKAAPKAKTDAGALDAEQERAVTAQEAAVAVIAGPGTGKTRTLVARIGHLVETEGVKPGYITAVTFTNKAAGEIRERLEGRLGKKAAKAMTIGTFHSICLDLLSQRPEGARLAGPYETLELAGEVLGKLGLKMPPDKLLREVSRRKNGADADLPEAVFAAYCASLGDRGLLDFDDLLLETLALWEGGAVTAKTERAFRYLLVDEFQDIDPVQYRLVRAWSGQGESLFVIGDPDQAIYGFRGSDAACFQRLAEDCPDLRTITLGRNYRSTPEILSCALPVIGRDLGGPRRLEAVRTSGAKVRLLTAETAMTEAIFVAKEIGRMVGGIGMMEADTGGNRGLGEAACSFSDIAVLYRTRRQADLLERCLARDGIPCVVTGRDDFLTGSGVRGALCFFRLLLSPEDTAALSGCLRLAWDCPEDLIGAVCALWSAAEGSASARASAVRAYWPEPDPLARWLELTAQLGPIAARETPGRLLDAWGRAMGCQEAEDHLRLRNMAVFHSDMTAFLQNLTIGREGDLLRSAGMAYDSGAVRLMTLHGAKGLEFPVVFLCGAEKGRIPLESADPAEERRLFYVGLTRAREELILLAGKEPSPFLEDLPADCLERGRADRPRPRPEGVQMSLF